MTLFLNWLTKLFSKRPSEPARTSATVLPRTSTPMAPASIPPVLPVVLQPTLVPQPTSVVPPPAPSGPKFQSNPVKPLFITQQFGEDPAFYARFNMKGHNGLDCRTKFNDSPDGKRPIFAVMDGVVSEAVSVDSNGYGRYVRLLHTDGSQTIYAHLDSLSVSLNQNVKGGDAIGISDNTGTSTAPHLHFGYRPKNFKSENGFKGYEDPEPFLI